MKKRLSRFFVAAFFLLALFELLFELFALLGLDFGPLLALLVELPLGSQEKALDWLRTWSNCSANCPPPTG